MSKRKLNSMNSFSDWPSSLIDRNITFPEKTEHLTLDQTLDISYYIIIVVVSNHYNEFRDRLRYGSEKVRMERS